MTRLRKIVMILALAVYTVTALSACGKDKSNTGSNSKDNNKLNVVTTIFPQYDFLRQIGGEHLNLTMLLSPGAESHSFEPTPKDMKSIENSALFVYVGGESDTWVEGILDGVDNSKTKIITLMDCVTTVEEEIVEGMTEEHEHEDGEHEDGEHEDAEHEHEAEYDEHVWTSPENAKLIVKKLCDALCEADPEHAEDYKKNTKEYLASLDTLDQKFEDVVDNAKRKEIIVADRFPFRYFVDEYGLTYYAAFPGCATDTEANAATIAFLTDKVKNDGIPVVFHIELSNEKICESISESTGAKSELLNAVHNISKSDFEAGVTYIDLMEHNVKVLKEALN